MLSRDSPRRGSPTGAATHKSGENSNTNSPASTTALPGRSLSTPMSVTTAALDSVTASLAGTRIHGGGDREAMPPTPAVPTRAPTDPAPYGRRGSLPGGGSMQPEPTSAAPLSPASAMSALPLLYGRSAQGRDDGEEGDDEESGSYADTRDDDDASDTEGGALTAGDIPSEIPLSQAHSPVFGSASAPISSFSGSPHRSHRRSFWVGNVSDRATRDDLIAHFGSFPGFIDLYYMKQTRSCFVNMATDDAVEEAALHFHGHMFKNSRLICRSRLHKPLSEAYPFPGQAAASSPPSSSSSMPPGAPAQGGMMVAAADPRDVYVPQFMPPQSHHYHHQQQQQPQLPLHYSDPAAMYQGAPYYYPVSAVPGGGTGAPVGAQWVFVPANAAPPNAPLPSASTAAAHTQQHQQQQQQQQQAAGSSSMYPGANPAMMGAVPPPGHTYMPYVTAYAPVPSASAPPLPPGVPGPSMYQGGMYYAQPPPMYYSWPPDAATAYQFAAMSASTVGSAPPWSTMPGAPVLPQGPYMSASATTGTQTMTTPSPPPAARSGPPTGSSTTRGSAFTSPQFAPTQQPPQMHPGAQQHHRHEQEQAPILGTAPRGLAPLRVLPSTPNSLPWAPVAAHLAAIRGAMASSPTPGASAAAGAAASASGSQQGESSAARAGGIVGVGPTPAGTPSNRYFIIKALSLEDLELSMVHRVWSPQAHLEPVLNTAFQGTDNVYLVFSVNKSGEFLGVARMTSQTGPGPMLNWSIHDTARRHALGGVMGVEWILCQRLPFSVVRHIANPWNQNKEVKVSRDGTELEPTVGQQLISEFIRFHDMQEALVRHGGAPQYPLPKRFVAYIPTFATGV